MFKFNDYVKASEIWETAKDYNDLGDVMGLARGYNIEVSTKDEKTHWLSCEFVFGSPEEHFNDDFHTWYYEEHGWTPTGRIAFRGYYEEHWDYEEREECYREISEEEVIKMSKYIVSSDENGRD